MEAIENGIIEIGDNTAIEQNVHITSRGGGTDWQRCDNRWQCMYYQY